MLQRVHNTETCALSFAPAVANALAAAQTTPERRRIRSVEQAIAMARAKRMMNTLACPRHKDGGSGEGATTPSEKNPHAGKNNKSISKTKNGTTNTMDQKDASKKVHSFEDPNTWMGYDDQKNLYMWTGEWIRVYDAADWNSNEFKDKGFLQASDKENLFFKEANSLLHTYEMYIYDTARKNLLRVTRRDNTQLVLNEKQVIPAYLDETTKHLKSEWLNEKDETVMTYKSSEPKQCYPYKFDLGEDFYVRLSDLKTLGFKQHKKFQNILLKNNHLYVIFKRESFWVHDVVTKQNNLKKIYEMEESQVREEELMNDLVTKMEELTSRVKALGSAAKPARTKRRAGPPKRRHDRV